MEASVSRIRLSAGASVSNAGSRLRCHVARPSRRLEDLAWGRRLPAKKGLDTPRGRGKVQRSLKAQPEVGPETSTAVEFGAVHEGDEYFLLTYLKQKADQAEEGTGESSSVVAPSESEGEDDAGERDAGARHHLDIPYQCDSDVGGLTVKELCRSSAVYNPEISWLAFNWRVLSQACSERVPLLEKLFFLGVSASNLDEFFAKRVGGLKRQLEASKADKLMEEEDPLIWSPDHQLKLIAENVKQLSHHQSQILHTHLEPRLAEEGVHITKRFADLSPNERERLTKYFTEELELLLTPIKMDPGHPFPFLQSLSIGLGVRLQDLGEDAAAEGVSYAVVTIPSTVDRWIKVETTGSEGGSGRGIAFLPVEQLIISHLDQLFGGWKILDAWPYRVTRNAELERHEDEAEDLLEMIAEEVRERMFAPFVRLEVLQGTPNDLVNLLTNELELNAERDVYHIESLLDLSDLKSLKIPADSHLSKLKYPRYAPVPMSTNPSSTPVSEPEGAASNRGESIFDSISRSDILVHHPYESFESSTLRFLEEASTDPDVLAIKTTVYRTSNDSPVIEALLEAAERRKEVAVLMELKARFDEARNVSYAQELEAAGCSVAYGLIGLKTHCKCMLVVRRERDSGVALKTYVHIGTGNYNPVTAGLYSDFSLFSCDPELGRDVMDVFKHLTGLHKQDAVGGYRKLLVAPAYMRQQFVEMIEREIENAKAGRHAAILVKVNGLDDRVLVSKLYEASQANVRVDCIVRGMCRLRPGVEGVSENIRVISVLGRFLEHHRVAVFHNDGDPMQFANLIV